MIVGVLVIILAVSLVAMAFVVVVVVVVVAGVDARNVVGEVWVVVLFTIRQSGLAKLLVFLHGIVQ